MLGQAVGVGGDATALVEGIAEGTAAVSVVATGATTEGDELGVLVGAASDAGAGVSLLQAVITPQMTMVPMVIPAGSRRMGARAYRVLGKKESQIVRPNC